MTKRHELYEAAKALHPERWNNRNTRNWSLPENASLNPDKVEEPAVDGDADAKFHTVLLIHIYPTIKFIFHPFC